jgi:prepilin-type N-terminal cleavage/methylation domain-containing protein
MTTLRSNDAHRSQRGFSFIEILIVMGIIAVLVGMVVVGTQIWGRKGPEFLTRARLQKVQAGITEWKRAYEAYPPTDPADIPKYAMSGASAVKGISNKSNMGIESVVLCLYWKGFNYDPQIQEDEFINTDEDELRAGVDKFGTKALREIRDEWNNPIIYIDSRSYAKADGDPVRYTTELGDVDVRPWRNEDGTFAQPMSFQLFSMGPDGEPNTDDDIRAWVN